jgi:sigma-B regulation protein RsbU (phosphoserine phosphatase)
VYTGEPRLFDWFDIAMLQSLAAQAAAAISNARLHAEAVESADLKRQLKIAAEVQRRLTPANPPAIAGLDIGALYAPCFELGGDFYDFIHLPPDNLGLAVCDVSGKGIPASLLMASMRASLRAHAVNIYDMSTVLDRVNRDLCADAAFNTFATLFYGVIDCRTRRFTYANAGHVPPILIRGGAFSYLTTGGGVLGLKDDDVWRHEHLTFQPGDTLLTFTDGLSDAMNHEDQAFGRARIESAATAAIGQGRSAAGIARHVVWEMRRFAGLQNRFDDLTLVVLRVL